MTARLRTFWKAIYYKRYGGMEVWRYGGKSNLVLHFLHSLHFPFLKAPTVLAVCAKPTVIGFSPFAAIITFPIFCPQTVIVADGTFGFTGRKTKKAQKGK